MRSSARTPPARPGTTTGSAGATRLTIASASPAARPRSGSSPSCVKKELRALSGDTIANYWEGEWQDRVTGKQMAGRGVEIWVMRDGKIAIWEAAFNFNEKGK